MNKSMKLRIAAKLILCIGLIACLVGCTAYCVLSLPEVMNLPFSWLSIVAVLAAMVVFIAIAIVLNLIANAVERKAMMVVEEEIVEEEAPAEYVCDNECCNECAYAESCDFLATEKAAKEAAAAEAAEGADEEAAEETAEEVVEEETTKTKLPAFAEKLRDQLPEEKRAAVDKAVETVGVAAAKVKENADKIVPAVVAGVAVIAVAKGRKARRQAKARKNLLKWLGC